MQALQCNVCLMQEMFPEYLKVAVVIPIPYTKKGDKDRATNYCPISLLLQFDKSLKKIIYNILVSRLDKYSLLSEKQFGFRKNYTTDVAISNIYYDHLIKNID